jgi:hypothetical protein
MCLSLGFHRLAPTAVETSQIRNNRFLFWSVYALDKSVSLRVGRTSVLQDFDISSPLPAYPENPKHNHWHEVSLCWISFGRFQGRVFPELFSVSALSGDQGSRADKAKKLASELCEWRKKMPKVSNHLERLVLYCR